MSERKKSLLMVKTHTASTPESPIGVTGTVVQTEDGTEIRNVCKVEIIAKPDEVWKMVLTINIDPKQVFTHEPLTLAQRARDYDLQGNEITPFANTEADHEPE
jgi:hypothetical protein